MLNAEFDNLAAAAAHRAKLGGWIFASDCGRLFWFNLGFTASKVMLHPALTGMNGRLL